VSKTQAVAPEPPPVAPLLVAPPAPLPLLVDALLLVAPPAPLPLLVDALLLVAPPPLPPDCVYTREVEHAGENNDPTRTATSNDARPTCRLRIRPTLPSAAADANQAATRKRRANGRCTSRANSPRRSAR
jgi:hypothetical protein